ncbi:MAG: hypothetical protein C4524_04285 [Candidatus Zixiibacteriota bacterium]|nr:MAG: hypothetical protein C4524_04285 [candidate division Zixibacteria bacterium]
MDITKVRSSVMDSLDRAEKAIEKGGRNIWENDKVRSAVHTSLLTAERALHNSRKNIWESDKFRDSVSRGLESAEKALRRNRKKMESHTARNWLIGLGAAAAVAGVWWYVTNRSNGMGMGMGYGRRHSEDYQEHTDLNPDDVSMGQ